MFNQQELQILLGGVNAPEPPVDLDDLRQHTNYGGGTPRNNFLARDNSFSPFL